MAEIEFNYKGEKILIKSDIDEKMGNIFSNFVSKNNVNLKKVYFLYSGKKISSELTFSQTANQFDKRRNKMVVLVNDLDVENSNSNKKYYKPKIVICPTCLEPMKINIKDFKITLFDCKNGHEINNLSLDKYEKTQNIDLSKINCGNCQNSLLNADTLFKCTICKQYLCLLCKTIHDKSHNAKNFEQKDMCEEHNENYYSYCNKCKQNLCMKCENEHSDHEIIYFGRIMPNEKDLKSKINEWKNNIDKFNRNIKDIIEILNNVMSNINKYFNLLISIINNIETNYRNFEVLYNINEMSNSEIMEEINKINEDYNINNKFANILNIFNKIIFENIENINKLNTNNNYQDEIKIIYKITNSNQIKIFGKKFVENNINICKIIHNDNEYNLNEYFNIQNNNYYRDTLEIILKGMNNVTDMSYMFHECTSLLYVPDFFKINTIKVKNMASLFDVCNSLQSLPDLSNWNTSNVTDMSGLFNNCKSIQSLPDISKWNTSNVTNMSYMFSGCGSLSYLPDISKWNTSNAVNMSGIFSDCSSLLNIPDISIWNTFNVTDISYMFFRCRSLSSLPDISKWNTSKITDMYNMFYQCSSLFNLPNISISNNTIKT